MAILDFAALKEREAPKDASVRRDPRDLVGVQVPADQKVILEALLDRLVQEGRPDLEVSKVIRDRRDLKESLVLTVRWDLKAIPVRQVRWDLKVLKG